MSLEALVQFEVELSLVRTLGRLGFYDFQFVIFTLDKTKRGRGHTLQIAHEQYSVKIRVRRLQLMGLLGSYGAIQVRAFVFTLCKLDIVDNIEIYRFGSNLIYLFNGDSCG